MLTGDAKNIFENPVLSMFYIMLLFYERNGRFRYRIIDDDDNIYSREELSKKLNLSQSYTDALIKKAANGISNKYFDKFGIYVADVKHKS